MHPNPRLPPSSPWPRAKRASSLNCPPHRLLKYIKNLEWNRRMSVRRGACGTQFLGEAFAHLGDIQHTHPQHNLRQTVCCKIPFDATRAPQTVRACGLWRGGRPVDTSLTWGPAPPRLSQARS